MKSVRIPVILLVLILLVMSPVTVSAAYDMFLNIVGFPGQSTDRLDTNWIKVESFEHDLSQPKGGSDSVGVEGNLEAGRVDHGEFQITKTLDKASPKLAGLLQKGQPAPPVTFELCELVGGEYRVLMRYTLKNPKVVKVKQADSGETTPTEEVRFSYGETHWEYTPTVSNDADGILLRGLYNEDGILEVNSEEAIKGNPEILSFD